MGPVASTEINVGGTFGFVQRSGRSDLRRIRSMVFVYCAGVDGLFPSGPIVRKRVLFRAQSCTATGGGWRAVPGGSHGEKARFFSCAVDHRVG